MRTRAALLEGLPFVAFALALTATSHAKVGVDASLEQGVPQREDLATSTYLEVSPSLKVGEKGSIRLVQGLTKYYTIDEVGGEEFAFEDTVLSYSHSIAKDFHSFAIGAKLSASLPLSSASRNTGVYSRPQASLSVSRKFFGDRLSIAYSPYVQTYFNEYSTSPNGVPLRYLSLGNRLTAEFGLPAGFRVGGLVHGTYHFTGGDTNGRYGYDLNLGYEINSILSARVGISHADRYVREGRYEILLYDPLVTRSYAAVDISL